MQQHQLLQRLVVLLVLVTGCSEPPETYESFTFVEKRSESGDFPAEMQLYALTGEFDPEEFRGLCVAKKASATTRGFIYVVLFDTASNAAFPDSPFTSLFGIEEAKMRHIKALYEYNFVNNYSQMTIYSPNMWEGKPKTEKI